MTKQTLVAECPDGAEIRFRTGTSYCYAAVGQNARGWEIVAKGFSAASIRSRARTVTGRWEGDGWHLVPVYRADQAVPGVIRAYFGHRRARIAGVFKPGCGWQRLLQDEAPTAMNLDRMRGQGVTAVAVRPFGDCSRLADFQMDELGVGR